MHITKIKGRAIHNDGFLRVDRRPDTDPRWVYQRLKLFDPDDGPEWVPADPEDVASWPQEGWNSVDDWQ